MPPTAEDRLLDILEAIAEIDKMLAAILGNSPPIKCVEWRLSVISKSSARLHEGFLMISSRPNEISIGAR